MMVLGFETQLGLSAAIHDTNSVSLCHRDHPVIRPCSYPNLRPYGRTGRLIGRSDSSTKGADPGLHEAGPVSQLAR